ncbi:MAG TPA: selenium cofactor biosynthesis protein YqeC [Chloroflexota bacterium]
MTGQTHGIAPRELSQACEIGEGSLAAVIGAGGKTSLLLGLGHELASRGLATVLTTTTHIWPPKEIPLNLLDHATCGGHAIAVPQQPLIQVVAQSAAPNGKLRGVIPENVEAIRRSKGAQVLLCEADGAAGRSLKVHASHEPVIPPASTHVLIVAGIDCVGLAPEQATVHRLDQFRHHFPDARDRPISSSTVARCLLLAARYVPQNARLYFILNKADTIRAREIAHEIELDVRAFSDAPVLATRYGRLVAEV